MASLIDSHCHLDLPHFDEDRDAVVARAAAAGVEAIVTIGIDLDHSRAAIELAERYSQVYATVGVHPNDCGDFGPHTPDALRKLAQHPKVVAIGEIGLDYYWDRTPPSRQREVFRQQLDLAAELGLPVVIHDREAHEDVRAQLRAWVKKGSLPGSPLSKRAFVGVLHSFSGDLAMAEEAYEWGFILGLAGPVTFKNARALHALVPYLRPDRLMIETDAPYLSPHPYRGQRNEPARVGLVAEKLAELWRCSPEDVARQTTATARRFYGLDAPTSSETRSRRQSV
ncbi:MAG: TatD family deoxyribonuclease [Caldilineae bacterium]|nr:MAG: TatD family deoxyribonuclease [Caldilineae bacterium]